MNLFLPEDLCSDEGLGICQRPSVLDFEHPEFCLRDAPSHSCWCHSCWTLICNSIGAFFPPAIPTHKGFTSATFNLIRHGLVPEYECISFRERYLCDPGRKIAGGVDDSRRWKAVSAYALETRFFFLHAHASSTLTHHDK